MFRWRVGGKRINMRKFFYLISSIVLFASCSSAQDAYAGVKRALVSPYFLFDAMLTTNTIIISYDTPNEHIEYISFPQLHFEEQAKDCPRLMAVMNEIENNK